MEPCTAKSTQQEKHGREKLLCSLKDIIKLVEQECTFSNESSKQHSEHVNCSNVEGVPCPPDAMVCCKDN